MLVTQNYAQRSAAIMDLNGLWLNVATEQSRPSVRLHATIKDGLTYARLMLTLYAVVTTDLRTPKKDRTTYFEWVHQRYLEELAEQQAEALTRLPALRNQRNALKQQIKTMHQDINELYGQANSTEYWEAYRRYSNYLSKYNRELWYALDPVVSVHPDCVIFEAFSKDESSYGRVTVPMAKMELQGSVDYGTTNIDFSPDLAREIGRIRSYRPTDLQVGAQRVVVSTGAGAAVEKKIDLPPTWVRGFLQVQSAATLPGVKVRLSAATLAEALSELRRKREDKGPRSIKFILQPGEFPSLFIEPWNIVIKEYNYRFEGKEAQQIRLWGRRRLLSLESLLPHATEVQVYLLGTGMPSYWSIFQADSRFDLGLSGWTQNDWSRAAQFDLLASTAKASAAQLGIVTKALETQLHITPEALAENIGLSREIATTALQQLCREGRAMYDHVTGAYRWRQLFPFMPEREALEDDPRLASVRRLLERKAVIWTADPLKNPPPLGKKVVALWRFFELVDAKSNKFWAIKLEDESHSVLFGRIGTSGQQQTKDFDTAKEAKESYEKLVHEKTNKGYKEINPTAITNEPAEPVVENGKTRYQANVKGDKTFEVLIDLDLDGRVVYAQCTCSAFRRDKLRKGPCPHILATTVQASQELAANPTN